MPDNSFDVVSKIDLPKPQRDSAGDERDHAALRPKDSQSNIELNEKDNKILLASKDEFKLKAVIEILQASW